jgi:uncharacterized coiled-coil protein SlyX
VTSSHRGLGFDPAPGDPRRAGALADALTTASGHAADGANQLDAAMTASEPWHGDAGDGVRRRGSELAARLTPHQERATEAAQVLYDWAATLADLQRRTDEQDRQARALRDRIADAEQAVDEWTTALSVASTHAHAATEATLAAHEQTLNDLRGQLNSVLAQAQRIATEHRTGLDDTTTRLRALLPDGSAPTTTTTTTGMGTLLAGLSSATRRAAAAAGLPRRDAPTGPPAAGALALASAPAPARPSGSWVFGRSVSAHQLRTALQTEGGQGAGT